MKNKLLVVAIVFFVLLFVGLGIWYFTKLLTSSSDPISASTAVQTIKNQFPELSDYPSDNLPPRSIQTEKADNGWYVAFVQEGSGLPIISARCFLVTDEKKYSEKKYVPQDIASTGTFSAKNCSLTDKILGGDADEHGCIGSAGYSWCAEKQKCLRIWEESCNDGIPGSKCVVENCHDFNDIQCGSNSPDVCTEMYMIGDMCLPYAQCGIQSGKCQQVENSQFTHCKSCVQNCISKYGDNSEELFNCESECR